MVVLAWALFFLGGDIELSLLSPEVLPLVGDAGAWRDVDFLRIDLVRAGDLLS